MSETTEKRRARSMAEMGAKMQAMFGAAEAAAEPFVPAPDDVIISPFGKSGTTWLQQMFHTLRTRGDEDYDDISRVVPWIETSPALGIDLNAPQKARPRGFKSHLSWDAIPKGGRYIVSIRDPRDAAVSMYKFMEGWFLEPGSVSAEEFTRANFMRDPANSYWGHLASWWLHRDDDHVLLLSYEGMNADHEGTIRRVAEFCDIELDDELLELTLNNSSLDYMLANKNKFDDLLMRELSERVADLPHGSDSAKVREGKVGSHARVLGTEILAEMDRIWAEEIEGPFGFENYEALEAAIRAL